MSKVSKKLREDVRRGLLEVSGDSHDYGCVMLYMKIKDKDWKSFQDMIDDEDIYTEKGDQSYGREDEPHVTILYGLHATITDSTIEELINEIKPPVLNLNKIGIFENEKFDVVKFDIIGESKERLSKMNAKFAKLPHTTDYPDYHPHATIAYVKPGTGKKYVKTFSGEEIISITPTDVVYSKADGTKNKYKLK